MGLTTKSKVEAAINWIDNLSKTKAKQGQGELGDKETGYCCLGYGCEITGVQYSLNDATSKLFQKKIGLKDDVGGFDRREFKVKENTFVAAALTELNDDVKFSFRRISTFIKKNLDQLFIPPVAKELKNYYNQ